MIRERPQPATLARRGAPRAARALVGGGVADRLNAQRADAERCVVAGDASQTAVHDKANAFNGDRGFGDVGGDNDLAAGRWLEDAVLLLGWQFAVERQQR